MRTLLFISCFAFHLVGFSQSEGLIIGVVTDVNTEEPLPFVKVFVEGTETGAITNFEGKYKISIKTGTYNVNASYDGYNALKKYNIVLSSGNAQVVNFQLEKKINQQMYCHSRQKIKLILAI